MSRAARLWGTQCGVWAGAPDVPWTSLKAWNPPILVGAFYGLGDLLVNLATDTLAPAVAEQAKKAR